VQSQNTGAGAWAKKFDAQWLVIGVCLAVVAVLALVPFGFMVWQSFLTPETAAQASKFTLSNYTTAYSNPDIRYRWLALGFCDWYGFGLDE
jgi:iron(III) transport system permease protein